MVLREPRTQFTQSCGDRFEDVLFGVGRHLLLQVRDAQTLLAPGLTVILLRRAGNNSKQSGFARPVAADEAHSLAGLDLKIDMVEQGHMTIRQRYIVETKQRHELLLAVRIAIE